MDASSSISIARASSAKKNWCEMEGCIARTAGHCTVMGTASTMTSLAEALGMTLTGCAVFRRPIRDERQLRRLSGQRIVEMV